MQCVLLADNAGVFVLKTKMRGPARDYVASLHVTTRRKAPTPKRHGMNTALQSGTHTGRMRRRGLGIAMRIATHTQKVSSLSRAKTSLTN